MSRWSGWAPRGATDTLYDAVFDRLALRLDPEAAHLASLHSLARMTASPRVAGAAAAALAPPDPVIATSVMGLDFTSPLGLAAGFDKDARAVDGLAALGFGAVEIGTVTGRAQPGNPKPRLFRLPADRAIVNRMGFNNAGAPAVSARLAARTAARRPAGPVMGVNIGRTKVVPAAEAAADYVSSTRLLAPHADYLVVNVSSPNTPGLRDLQAVEVLRPLLAAVQEALAAAVPDRAVPLLVKIAPDLADEDVVGVADLAESLGLAGIIATNTTVARDGLRTAPAEVEACGAGGLSGPVLAERSREVLRLLHTRLAGRLTLISVGGVTDADDVWDRMTLGASLVQAYTGLIYGGPRWPAMVNAALARRAREQGVDHISEIVGTAGQ